MVIVDDHLTLFALADVIPVAEFGDNVATTSLWYLRLVSAATAPTGIHGLGRLGRILHSLPEPAAALERITHPPREPRSTSSTRWSSRCKRRGCSASDG